MSADERTESSALERSHSYDVVVNAVQRASVAAPTAGAEVAKLAAQRAASDPEILASLVEVYLNDDTVADATAVQDALAAMRDRFSEACSGRSATAFAHSSRRSPGEQGPTSGPGEGAKTH